MSDSNSERDAAADAYATTKRKWSQDGERFTHEEHAQGIGLSICPSTAKAFRKGADWGHARALKEMDAEVARLQGEIVKRNQYKLNEQALANVHEHYEKRLAAAQSEIARLNTLDPAVIAYDTRSVRALTNLIKERDDLREQLAACELRAGEYEKALEFVGCQGFRAKREECTCARCKVLVAHRRGGEGVT